MVVKNRWTGRRAKAMKWYGNPLKVASEMFEPGEPLVIHADAQPAPYGHWLVRLGQDIPKPMTPLKFWLVYTVVKDGEYADH